MIRSFYFSDFFKQKSFKGIRKQKGPENMVFKLSLPTFCLRYFSHFARCAKLLALWHLPPYKSTYLRSYPSTWGMSFRWNEDGFWRMGQITATKGVRWRHRTTTPIIWPIILNAKQKGLVSWKHPLSIQSYLYYTPAGGY